MEDTSLKFNPQPNSIIFNTAEGKEMIRLEKGKFFWKAKEVKDVNKIYERFSEWMKLAEQSK